MTKQEMEQYALHMGLPYFSVEKDGKRMQNTVGVIGYDSLADLIEASIQTKADMRLFKLSPDRQYLIDQGPARESSDESRIKGDDLSYHIGDDLYVPGILFTEIIYK